MNTPSSALSDEMKGAMSTLLNAVIFEQWLRFSWIEEDEVELMNHFEKVNIRHEGQTLIVE